MWSVQLAVPLAAYEGSKPYIFVSYAHSDETLVFAEMRRLQDSGVNVWYDSDIHPGSEWSDSIASAIKGADRFVYFITPRSVASENCRRELNFAIEHNVMALAVQLEPTDVPDGTKLLLNNRQSIIKSELSAEQYRNQLGSALGVDISPAALEDRNPARAKPNKAPRWIAGFAVMVILATTAYFYLQFAADRAWLTNVARPEIMTYISNDEYGLAFNSALAAEKRIGGKVFEETIWQQIASPASIDSTPNNAAVSYRLYTDTEWTPIGTTPIKEARLPRDMLVLKYEKDGFATSYRVTYNPGLYATNPTELTAVYYDDAISDAPAVRLVPRDQVPNGMVYVPTSSYRLHNLEKTILPDFFIDRDETTNTEYQSFVDADGYSDPSYWSDLAFDNDGASLSWEQAMEHFRDTTNRPGPAGWSLSRFPDGAGQQPVTGISWFEAMAYARYRDKSLPTLHHWSRAAQLQREGNYPIAPKLIVLSNFSGALEPIGGGAIGPFGTHDMAGNVREWVANTSDELRFAMGGAAIDAPYVVHHQIRKDPWSRDGMTGTRNVRYRNTPAPVVFSNRSGTTALPPLSEAAPEIALDAYLSTLEFVPFDAEPLLISEHDQGFGVLRKISLNMSRNGGRFEAYVFIPKGYKPPYQSMVYMSGTYAFNRGAQLEPWINWEVKDVFSPYLRSGRAIIWPVWYGSYERYDGMNEAPNELRDVLNYERLKHWVTDMAAIVAYLDASEDFNDRVAWLGLSYGAAVPRTTHFFTPPFRTAILLSGSAPMHGPLDVSYYRRFSLPVLLLKGRFDQLLPVASAERWFNTIATPADDKRLVIYDTNHWPLPRNQMIREVIDWLDHYLGPVDRPVFLPSDSGPARANPDAKEPRAVTY